MLLIVVAERVAVITRQCLYNVTTTLLQSSAYAYCAGWILLQQTQQFSCTCVWNGLIDCQRIEAQVCRRALRT